MLAVLSDLHFQDTNNDVVKSKNGNIMVNVERNISPKAFRFIFDEFIDIANKIGAQELNIVLAGDIFDLNRSQTWLRKGVRPYGKDAGEKWLPVAKEVLNDIVASNRETFALFREFAGRTLANGKPVTFTYLPGNHDRLVNLHADLRRQVGDLFGIRDPQNRAFPHEIVLPDYGVHIRHGHEYDQTNFAGPVPACGPLPCNSRDYDAAPMGDFVTIDIAVRIAYEYRQRHEEDIRAGHKVHCAIYRKLLEFDDVRPASDLISFIRAEMADGEEAVEEYFMPVADVVLGDALKSDFLRKWLGCGKIALARVIKYFSTQALLGLITGMDSKKAQPWEFALREPDLHGDDGPFRYAVAGHTHNPDIVYLRRNGKGEERFFIDTGTWRQQIRRCEDGTTFARATALTYALFYSPAKDSVETGKAERFDYWSGYTKTIRITAG